MRRERLRTLVVRNRAFIGLLALVVIAAASAGVVAVSNDEPTHPDPPQERNCLAVERATANATEDPTVDSVTLTVVGGTTNIDIAASTVEWLGPNAARTLVHGNRTATNAAAPATAPGEGEHITSVVPRDRDGSAPVLDGPDDRFEVVVNATAVGGHRLQRGDEVTLKLITPRGAVTRYDVTIPQSLAEGTTVEV